MRFILPLIMWLKSQEGNEGEMMEKDKYWGIVENKEVIKKRSGNKEREN